MEHIIAVTAEVHIMAVIIKQFIADVGANIDTILNEVRIQRMKFEY